MRIFIPPLSAAGFSEWVDLDYRQKAVSTTIQTLISNSASLTFDVDYTLQDPNAIPIYVTASQTTTTITVTFPSAHYLLVGDYVNLMQTGTAMDGEYSVTAVSSATVVTLTASSRSATGGQFTQVVTCAVGTLPNMSALSASKDTTLLAPYNAVRLRVATYTSGSVWAHILQGDSN